MERKEPDLVFTSLYHHILDVDNLRACYDSLEAGKATGMYGVTKQQYGKDPESNLEILSERLGRMSCRSGAKRRSYGYRPRRSQHQCLDVLGRTIWQKRINCVAEADIESFFDQVNHQWRDKFLRHRIGDERVIRVIIRMLKNGIMEDGLVKVSELGTPQGSILSPLLSNIGSVVQASGEATGQG
jgi:hypothetical protein